MQDSDSMRQEIVARAAEEVMAQVQALSGPLAETTAGPPSPLLMELAADLEAIRPVEEQSFRWQPATRLERIQGASLGEPAKARLGEAVRKVGGGWISRKTLFGLASEDALALAVGVVAWGGGERWSSVIKAAETIGLDELERRLERQLHASRNPGSAWGSWTTEDHVKGIGPVYGSKLAYFASARWSREGLRPLIVDRRVSWAIWALNGLDDVRKARSIYLDYVAALHRWGASIRPDAIERALFELGKPLPDQCRKAYKAWKSRRH